MRRHALARHLTAAALAAFLVLGAGASGAEARFGDGGRSFVNVGTAGMDGVYFQVGTALCRLLNDGWRRHGIRCAAQATPGSSANLAGVADGRLPLALVQQSDVETLEREGAVTLIAPVYDEALVVLARDADIRSFDDLRRMRLDIGMHGSGTRSAMRLVLGAIGWSPQRIATLGDLTTSAAVEAVCSRKIEAMALMVGHPSGLVRGALERCGLRPVVFPADELAQIDAASPHLRRHDIGAGTYPGLSEPTPTLATTVLLVAAPDLPDRVALEVAMALDRGVIDLRRGVPALAKLKVQDLYREVEVPALHPGVEDWVAKWRP